MTLIIAMHFGEGEQITFSLGITNKTECKSTCAQNDTQTEGYTEVHESVSILGIDSVSSYLQCSRHMRVLSLQISWENFLTLISSYF